jgi:outer membrane protein assembly factor BamB
MHSTPAIGKDGTIFIGSSNGILYAVNPNGSLKWAYNTMNYFVETSPSIGSDGTIYIASTTSVGKGRLYAIDPLGTLKWFFETAKRIQWSSPAIDSHDTIYVGCDDAKLYAIGPNGTIRWTYNTGAINDSSPAIGADGTIYLSASYPSDKLFAIHADGSIKWIYQNYLDGMKLRSSVAIGSDGTIYAGSSSYLNKGHLYAINPNGTDKWRFEIIGIGGGGSGQVGPSPAIGPDGTIYFGADYTLYAVETSSGGLASTPWPMYHRDARHTGRIGGVILGDLNHDSNINLEDVITALNVITRTTQPITFINESDVNYDGKIGLQEAIYLIQVVAEIRPKTIINFNAD